VPLPAGVDERAPDRRQNGCACDLRSGWGQTSLQQTASIDYLRYGALQICIGLQSLRLSALRCARFRLAREGMTSQRWKIYKLQPTIDVAFTCGSHATFLVSVVGHLKLNINKHNDNVSHLDLLCNRSLSLKHDCSNSPMRSVCCRHVASRHNITTMRLVLLTFESRARGVE
jgi:hypothetical protein